MNRKSTSFTSLDKEAMGACDLEPPSKRFRAGMASCCALETIQALTENGNRALKRSEFSEAQQFYTRALAQVETKRSRRLSNPLRMKLGNDLAVISKGSSSNSIELSSKATVTPATEQPKYDENMDVFQEPFVIDSTLTQPEGISARLRFNISIALVANDRFEEALSVLEKALQEIRSLALKDSKLEFCLLHKYGFSQFKLGKAKEALVTFETASKIALQNPTDKVALAACMNCLGVIHFHHEPNKAETAMHLLKQSLALYQQVFSGPSKEVATVLNNIGRVHFLLSQYHQALAVYHEALFIRVQVLEPNSVDVAATLYNTGQSFHQIGQLDNALQFYKRFLSLKGKGLGPYSRDAGIVYRGIGEIHQDKGDTKSALKAFEQALAAQKLSLGKYHLEVASTLNKLGNLCYEMQDFSGAIEFYNQGLEIENSILEPNHAHIVITLTNIAHIEKQRRNYACALDAYLKVHQKQCKAGADSITTAVTLSSIGLVQYHLKKYEDAFESYQEALRLRREHFGTDDTPDIASTLNSIGLVLFKQNMFALASNCFSESLRIRTKLLGKDHRDCAILWYNLATIHFETGNDDIAIQMYKETLRVERTALGPDHADVVLTLQHIGQVLQQVGKLEEALTYFHEALVVERRLKKDHVSIAKILNLIGNIQLQEGRVEEMMQSFTEASRILERSGSAGEALVIAGYNFYGLSKVHPKCAPIA
ncbi:MAG: hypothetical protein SGILL_004320 [Bacillariaceae sp.]